MEKEGEKKLMSLPREDVDKYMKKRRLFPPLSHFKMHWQLYLMLLPGLFILAVFSYYPMHGILIAFKQYNPIVGVWESEWAGNHGFENFIYAFASDGFWDLVANTLILGVLKLVFAFPSSIILALMFNEIRVRWFKKTVQTLSYLPYFISWVVVNAIVYMFLSTDYGLINNMLEAIGAEPVQWYAEPKYWRAILTFMTIWKNAGWGTIVFLAALTAISPDLYEAAAIDGAGRWKQTIHVSIPGIMSVIGITFVLNVASIVKDDFEMIYALVGDNALLQQTTEVLGTWIYKMLNNSTRSWGDATAVGLCQSILSLLLMIGANWVVKKTGNPSMW